MTDDQLRLIGTGSQRVFASAPPAALDAYRAANRLRRRGGGDSREKQSREAARFRRSARAWERKHRAHRAHPRPATPATPATQRGTRRISANDAEGRFLFAVGAVPVPEPMVPAPLVAAARGAASRAAGPLCTAEPEVRWFHTIRGGRPARGWFDKGMEDVIWISASLNVTEVPSVVAHESHHRADYLAGRPIEEAAARAFVARFRNRTAMARALGPRPTAATSPRNMRD